MKKTRFPRFGVARSGRGGNPAAFALMAAQTAVASWETILRRTTLMATGRCSPAEYQKMVAEKAQAAQASAAALLSGQGKKAALAPWHSRVVANAKRLRRGK